MTSAAARQSSSDCSGCARTKPARPPPGLNPRRRSVTFIASGALAASSGSPSLELISKVASQNGSDSSRTYRVRKSRHLNPIE